MRASTSGHSPCRALQLDADLCLQVRVFLEDLADKRRSCCTLRVNVSNIWVFALRPLREFPFQNHCHQGNGIQRRAEIVSHEGEILFPALWTSSAFCVAKTARPIRSLQEPVDDVERLPLQTQTMPVRQIVETSAEDVVLRDDFFDVDAVFEPLQTVAGGLPSLSDSGIVSSDLDLIALPVPQRDPERDR